MISSTLTEPKQDLGTFAGSHNSNSKASGFGVGVLVSLALIAWAATGFKGL
jgi:hypothetical protein